MSPECRLRPWPWRPSAGWRSPRPGPWSSPDAAAGVEAGRRGGFGLVVGLDRAGRRAALEAAGADVVVEDVSELDIGLVITHPWLLVYEGFDPAHEGHREALTTLGNGYLATRGAAPEHRAGGGPLSGHLPCGRLQQPRERGPGRRKPRTSTWSTSRTGCRWMSGWATVAWWSDGGLTLRSERRTLDLKRALLSREALLEDDAGRQLQVLQRRLVSMAEPHLAALETTLTAVGWSGTISIRSGCDTGVTNSNVPEDAQLANRHLTAVAVSSSVSSSEDGSDAAELTVQVQTIREQDRDRPGAADPDFRRRGSRTVGAGAIPEAAGGLYAHRFDAAGHGRRPRHGHQDRGRRDVPGPRHRLAPDSAALAVLSRAPQEFDALLADHEAAWSLLLAPFIIESDAPSQAQLILNLHVFHLLQTLTTHTAELDAGVPARGLHGEGYRGHIFWDELFVLPVLNSRLPAVARELIDYRWRRLGTARDAARKAGLRGALFPWQSGSDGTEQTPKFLFNKLSGHWMPDYSHLQRHVGPGGRLQRLAVLRSHPGPGLADPARRRDHGGRRQAVRLDGGARPRPGPVPYPGRHGPGRVPHRLSGQPRRRPGRQRLYQRHGGLGVRPGGLDHAFRAGLRHGGAPGTAGDHGHGNRRLGAPEPADVRALPRRRHHQPVRRLRRSSGNSTGSTTAAPTGTSNGWT